MKRGSLEQQQQSSLNRTATLRENISSQPQQQQQQSAKRKPRPRSNRPRQDFLGNDGDGGDWESSPPPLERDPVADPFRRASFASPPQQRQRRGLFLNALTPPERHAEGYDGFFWPLQRPEARRRPRVRAPSADADSLRAQLAVGEQPAQPAQPAAQPAQAAAQPAEAAAPLGYPGHGAVHQLLVHQTLLANERGYVFVSNINVPERLVQSPVARLVVARRIRTFVCLDYAQTPLAQFQITASFELQHTETGAIRQWTGSFNPSGNRLTSIHEFEPFDPPEAFERTFVRASDPDRVANVLRTRPTGVDSDWVFYRLISVIVSVQAIVGRTHHAIYSRQLLDVRSGRRRAIRSFPLP